MIRQYELVERVRSYDPDADEDLINRAYVFSMKAHGQQTRASGDPYFVHPLEVAGLLADMKLDSATIVTGLLHDTVEDTVATLDELETQFGIEVSALVDGVTKLSKLEHQSDQSKQAENFRKLVLAMSKDIRVLLVKLCDRLHNMRTLGALKKPERRARIARETLEIYAPLAERIGMHVMKDELEDLAFIYLNNDARDSIVRRLVQLRTEDSGTIGKIVDGLKQILEDGGITGALVVGREKRPYSIWRKMHVRNVPFEQMADIMAFRIIVGTMEECYQALGLIHAGYSSLPGRFKDYISTPKPNGYQSVHTAVIGPFRQRIEVQIRTQEMHQVAELGVAAHWIYKQGRGTPGHVQEPPYKWLRELLEILDNVEKPVEFLEHTKLELFQDQVFCFTPKGLVIALPQGATPIDFAYAVHTQVGDTCVGAKVNGRMTTLRTVLQNGDQVEIITSKTSTPSPEWMRTAVTGKARSRIRRFIRQKQRAEYAELGKAMLQKLFSSGRRRFQRASDGKRAEGLQAGPYGRSLRQCRIGRHDGTRGLHGDVSGSSLGPAKGRECHPVGAAPQQDAEGHAVVGRDPRADPRHGRTLCPLLSPDPGRSDRRHRDHGKRRDDPHDRLRNPRQFLRSAGAVARCQLEFRG